MCVERMLEEYLLFLLSFGKLRHPVIRAFVSLLFKAFGISTSLTSLTIQNLWELRVLRNRILCRKGYKKNPW